LKANANTRLVYIDTFVNGGNVKAIGANLGAIFEVKNLTTMIESLASEGEQVLVSSVKFQVRAWSSDEIGGEFSAVPIIVQTSNGSFSDQLNTAHREIRAMLVAACSDEFGFLKLGKQRLSQAKNVMVTTTPSTDILRTVEFEVIIPQSIINILNRSVSTERLQEILMAITACRSVAGNVYFLYGVEVEYTLRAKQIILR
jgi:hypothetical protein